ncbi:cytochrome-c oxidase [Ornithinibacillus sp. L9]|uniref:Cytochrome-c oxidase n=1 Tax=Ornithinibacillus caprae TaxID=2678566 RepID=A0A6N8FM58_9BACI|nr:cytochrome-c oxidase [Ornithinibacillus caprae]MUK88829.1 cytochrome-c oxidase [Ornithinibacillus caprae]
MGNTLIKISIWYFIVGVTLGLYMSMAHNYNLTGVHVHVNLLGWVSLAIAGIFYNLYPHLVETVSAKIHFWLHNIGLPVMMGALALAILGAGDIFLTFVAIGGVVTVLGIYFFGYNMIKNLEQ